MATLNYTAAQIDALLAKADTAVQPATTGDLDNLATSTKTDLVSAINETFTSVSDGKTLVAAAITDKGVATAATDSFSTMATNIAAIPSGGTVEAVEKDVNFIDYDGTILYSYSKADFANLSVMPDNPSHTGLTARGWNWSLSDAQAYVTANGGLWIGQMYYDANGATEIDIQLGQGRLAPYLALGVNGTVTIDWGDSSTADTVTGTSLTARKATQHTYSAVGTYTIKITPTSGTFSLYLSSTVTLLSKNPTEQSSVNINRVYAAMVKAIRIGINVSINQYAFAYTGIEAIVLPSGATIDGANICSNAFALKRISLPNTVTGTNNSMVNNCYLLNGISLPPIVTIGNSAFTNCYALSKITIPSAVTSIGTSALSNCLGLGEIHFKPTAPPTVSNSNTFSNLQTDCKIYVPTGKLSAYTSAGNYPSSSTYTYIEE